MKKIISMVAVMLFVGGGNILVAAAPPKPPPEPTLDSRVAALEAKVAINSAA